MKSRYKGDILSIIKRKGRVSSEMLAKEEGISRQGAHKKLSILMKQGKLLRIGSTRGAYYVKSLAAGVSHIGNLMEITLKNKGLEEHKVFENIEKKSPLFKRSGKKAADILGYAFTEMLNNAIEHSKSKKIDIRIYGENGFVCFEIIDYGIGVYNNLMRKFKVSSELEAIQELLKGKRTTMPGKHSGEGIFFTEKASDQFKLEGGTSLLVIDNVNDDMAVKETSKRKGTKVTFKIKNNSQKSLTRIFNKFTDEEFRFSKTMATIKLYQKDVDYVSRSQARRLLYDLDKFSTIILDFRGIKGVGQGFADEVFRVYKKEHPITEIKPINASKTVLFMIKRVAT